MRVLLPTPEEAADWAAYEAANRASVREYRDHPIVKPLDHTVRACFGCFHLLTPPAIFCGPCLKERS